MAKSYLGTWGEWQIIQMEAPPLAPLLTQIVKAVVPLKMGPKLIKRPKEIPLKTSPKVIKRPKGIPLKMGPEMILSAIPKIFGL